MRGTKVNLNKKVSTSVALDPEVISLMDSKRGQQSRSAWINALVLTMYEKVNE